MASCPPAGATADGVVVLSTLEWPPFASRELPEFGATSKVIVDAFADQGYRVRLSFNAWSESVEMARKGIDDVVAYYPGYHCRHRDKFIASEPIGISPLGFAEHVDAPIQWQTLDDIGEQGLKIGTVKGYTNTDEFDRRVGTGWIHAIPSENDVTNLRKLVRQRIDAAVIDQNVFSYLASTDAALTEAGPPLQFNRKTLGDALFYLCFREDDLGQSLKALFDAGLKSVDVDMTIKRYMESLPSQGP